MSSSTRDSSVLRSLAVAFGDGLAFGVGMKLTQTAAKRPSALPASPDLIPVVGRLEQIDERIRQLEQKPAAIAAPAASRYDQHVFEAVVQAVDARLKEQAALFERRLSDLEARLAQELQISHQQMQSVAGGAETRIHELEGAVQRELSLTRREMAEGLTSVAREAAALGAGSATEVARVESAVARVESRVGEMEAGIAEAVEDRLQPAVEQLGQILPELQRQIAAVRRELPETVESRVAGAICAAAEAAQAVVERRVVPIEAALAAKDAAIAGAEERSRLARCEVLDVLSAIGRMCEEAVDRLKPVEARPASAVVEPPLPPDPPPPLPPDPPTASGPELPEAAPAALETVLEEVERKPAETAGEVNGTAAVDDVPLFAQGRKPGRVWRIPLVSSLVMGCAGWGLARYLL